MTQSANKAHPKRVVLTAAALGAMNSAVSAALSGEEGEGDCADVTFADLERAQDWIHAEYARRAKRRRV
jgi:hypothetical protein